MKEIPADIPPVQKKPFWHVLTHPTVSVTSAIASIISVPLAFYFYYASIQSPGLTSYIHPVRTTLVSSNVPSALTVSYAGKQLSGSVHIVQCALWNGGGLPIKQEDILEPVSIQTGQNVRILEASIRDKTRDIIGFKLDISTVTNGVIPIAWKILEKGDGAAIQILYEGSKEASVLISGSIVGQKCIHIKKEPLSVALKVAIGSYLVLLLSFLLMSIFVKHLDRSNRIRLLIAVVVIIGLGSLTVMSSYGCFQVMPFKF